MKLKIKPKLIIGFSLIILLTCVLGAISFNSINQVSNELIPVMKANEKITSNMLELRKNEKDFFARSLIDTDFFETQNSKYLTDFNNNFNILQQEITVVKTFAQGDSEFMAKITEIEQLATQYKEQFLKVVEKQKEKGFKDWGRIGELRDSVHNVEDRLNEAGEQDALLVKMLMCRRHEKDYLLRNDPKYQGKLAERVEEFKALLLTSGLDSTTQSELSSLMDDYKTKFDSVVSIDEEIGRTADVGLMGDYRNTIHQLEPLVEEQSIILDNNVQSLVDKANNTVIVSIFLIIIIGIVFALLMANMITKPLRQMTEAGNKVADGNLKVDMPSIKTGDEVQDISETMNLLIGALKYHMKKKK
jgi:methyl-accepting chemotaxis protein